MQKLFVSGGEAGEVGLVRRKAWRLPKQSDLLGPKGMMTEHPQEQAEMLAWLQVWTECKKSYIKRKGDELVKQAKLTSSTPQPFRAAARMSRRCRTLGQSPSRGARTQVVRAHPCRWWRSRKT